MANRCVWSADVAAAFWLDGGHPALAYYGLPLSSNPRSVLYGKIGGTDELDVMTEYFDPLPTMPASQ
jgi:hypothetical protein